MVDAAVSGTQPPSEASNPTLDWVAGRWQHYEALWRAATAWAPPSAGYAGISLRLAARGDMDGAALAQWAHDVNATSAMLRRDSASESVDRSSMWAGLVDGLTGGRGARQTLDAARASLQRRVPGARLSSAFHIKDFAGDTGGLDATVDRTLAGSAALLEAAREIFAAPQSLVTLSQGLLCVFEAVLVASAEELGDSEGVTVRLREELVLTSWMAWRSAVSEGPGSVLSDGDAAYEALAVGMEALRDVLMPREALVFDALVTELLAGFGVTSAAVAADGRLADASQNDSLRSLTQMPASRPETLGPTW